jgi:uncharacterized membrane-anchored protein YhcB (DUF1043 family)
MKLLSIRNINQFNLRYNIDYSLKKHTFMTIDWLSALIGILTGYIVCIVTLWRFKANSSDFLAVNMRVSKLEEGLGDLKENLYQKLIDLCTKVGTLTSDVNTLTKDVNLIKDRILK